VQEVKGKGRRRAKVHGKVQGKGRGRAKVHGKVLRLG
jgi:hypothetical protein